jgi:serine/threonine protein phosphatase PrpC
MSIIQIPGPKNQDVITRGNNFVIICDGHGEDRPGRDIAEVVAACCAELIPPNLDICHETLTQLCQDFQDMICANFENWSKEFPNSGTTVLIVVFSPDGQTYMVVKLGDSYVLEIPEGFSGDGRPLAFDSVQLEKQDPEEETEWGTSMSPWQLFMKHRSEPGRGKGGSNAFWSYYGAKIFMQGHFFIRDRVRLRTMGIEPTLVKPGDDIRRVLESFTICGIFQRKPGHRLVIASDGLPIEDPEIWGILSSENALQTYFVEKLGHDDVTVVVVF